MTNRNHLWILVGLLTVGLVVAVKFKPQAQNLLRPSQPGVERPFTDDWIPGTPGTPGVPGTPPPTAPAPIPGTPKTYKEALEAASKGNKPLLLFFTGKACPPCQKMKSELAPSLPSVLGQLVYYEVDTDVEKDLVKKFNIQVTPSYIVVNGQEQVLKTGSGYKDVRSFGEWLAAPYQQPTPPPGGVTPPSNPAPPSSPSTPPSNPQKRPLIRRTQPGDPSCPPGGG